MRYIWVRRIFVQSHLQAGYEWQKQISKALSNAHARSLCSGSLGASITQKRWASQPKQGQPAEHGPASVPTSGIFLGLPFTTSSRTSLAKISITDALNCKHMPWIRHPSYSVKKAKGCQQQIAKAGGMLFPLPLNHYLFSPSHSLLYIRAHTYPVPWKRKESAGWKCKHDACISQLPQDWTRESRPVNLTSVPGKVIRKVDIWFNW